MIVECVAGYDGGLPQSFHLEALEPATKRLHINLTRHQSPIFRIDGTVFSEAEDSVLHLLLYSANPKGRSEAVIIEDIALNGAEKRTGTFFPNRIFQRSMLEFWKFHSVEENRNNKIEEKTRKKR